MYVSCHLIYHVLIIINSLFQPSANINQQITPALRVYTAKPFPIPSSYPPKFKSQPKARIDIHL